MALYPAAIQRPIRTTHLSGLTMAAYNRVNLHVAVSEASSLHDYFDAEGRPSSHFYVRKDGTVEQYVDTKLRAEADLDGNDATISVETQGGVSNANGEKWTDAQIDALARLFAWCVKTHGITVQLASTSKTDATSRGLSWHRLGIDGNFPALPSVLAGRQQRGGGMHYSSSAGKACPGNAKIEQVADIYAKAKAILAGDDDVEPVDNVTPAPAPKPKPKSPPSSDDIDTDGYWGTATTKALQRQFGTEVDGEVWHQWPDNVKASPGLTAGWKTDKTQEGSPLIKAMQKKLGVKVDGLIGPSTIKALEKRYGYAQDGVLDGPSLTIKAMQRKLNEGTF